MNTPVLADESAVRTYTRLLLKLHDLIAEGTGDSEEADNIRDEMDTPGYALTWQEQQRMNGLSEDLYALAEGGSKPVVMSPAERQEWGKRFRNARNTADWDQILELCRRPPSDVPADAIAFMRARCWAHLGDMDVALLFLREADRLNPQNAAFVLAFLREHRRTADAVPYARRILDNPQSGALDLYLAATTLLAISHGLKDVQARAVLEEVVATLQRALALERTVPKQPRFIPEVETSMVCTLGLCYMRLGHHDAAMQVLDEALSRNPENAHVLTIRGIARYDRDRPAALKDFEGAIRVGTSSVWPSFLLAQSAMQQKDYTRSLSLCLTALQKASRPAILAELHNWMGISRLMLGHPAKSVQESFDAALRLDPLNERIQHNHSVAEAALTTREHGQLSWSLAKEDKVEEAEQELLDQQESMVSAAATNKRELEPVA